MPRRKAPQAGGKGGIVKLIAILVAGAGVLITVVTVFKVLGFWGAMFLLALAYLGMRRG